MQQVHHVEMPYGERQRFKQENPGAEMTGFDWEKTPMTVTFKVMREAPHTEPRDARLAF